VISFISADAPIQERGEFVVTGDHKLTALM